MKKIELIGSISVICLIALLLFSVLNSDKSVMVTGSPDTCAEIYTGGDWVINSSITCQNEEFTVNGSIMVGSAGGYEVNTDEFILNPYAAHDLRGNSTYIDQNNLPMTDTNIPEYTNDWDPGNSTFKIVMNESQNAVEIFGRIDSPPAVIYLYQLDMVNELDHPGFIVGYANGTEPDIPTGMLVGCLNSSDNETGYSFAVIGETGQAEGSYYCADPYMTQNFTIYYNVSDNVFNIALFGDGEWHDKAALASTLDYVTGLTLFKNSPVLEPTYGSLILLNTTIHQEAPIWISSGSSFTMQDSMINFSLDHGVFGGNGSANMLFEDNSIINIDHSTLTSDSDYFWGLSVQTSLYNITNNLIDHNGIPDQENYTFNNAFRNDNGGVVQNNTFTKCGGDQCILVYGNNRHMRILGNRFVSHYPDGGGMFGAPLDGLISGNYFASALNYPRGNAIIYDNIFDYQYGEYQTMMYLDAWSENVTLWNNHNITIVDTKENLTVSNIVVYNNSFGEVRWTLYNASITPRIDIGNGIVLSDNRIEVGVEAWEGWQNLNTSAQLKFYGISFSPGSEQLLKNGVRCDNDPALCNITYDFANKILYANVSGFSNYSTNGTVVNLITDCGNINESGYYMVASDLLGNLSNQICLNISANNTVIDGAGHSITGNFPALVGTPTANTTYGVRVYNVSNIEVFNLSVSNYSYGFYAISTPKAQNISLHDNEMLAMIPTLSSTVANTYLSGSAYMTAHNVSFYNNYIHDSMNGVRFLQDSDCLVYGNTFANITENGLLMTQVTNFVVQNNTFNDVQRPISLFTGSYTVLSSYYSWLSTSVISNNTCDGNPTYYGDGVSNVVINSPTCFVYYKNGENITVTGINFSRTGTPVKMFNITNAAVENSSIYDAYDAIELTNSTNINYKNLVFTNRPNAKVVNGIQLSTRYTREVSIDNISIYSPWFNVIDFYYDVGVKTTNIYSEGNGLRGNSSLGYFLLKYQEGVSNPYAENITLKNANASPVYYRNTITNATIKNTYAQNVSLEDISYGAITVQATDGLNITNFYMVNITAPYKVIYFLAYPQNIVIENFTILNSSINRTLYAENTKNFAIKNSYFSGNAIQDSTSFYLAYLNNFSIESSTVRGFNTGVYAAWTNWSLTNVHLCDLNTAISQYTSGGRNTTFNASFISIDSPLCAYSNFTNISVNDYIGTTGGYQINWSSLTSKPNQTLYFKNGTTGINGTAFSIDDFSIFYSDSAIGALNESKTAIYKFNSSGWFNQTFSLNETLNKISMQGINSSGLYGVFNTAYPGSTLLIWNGSEYIKYNLSNQMKFRCSNPPTTCYPTYQNSTIPILINLNSGDWNSSYQEIKTNTSFGTANLFCGFSNFNDFAIINFTGSCYQETANVATSCGGLSGGNYSLGTPGIWDFPERLYDGNWGTVARISSGSTSAYAYPVYKKPAGSTNNSILYARLGTGAAANYSIPAACWNYNSSTLYLRLRSRVFPAESYLSCGSGDGVWTTVAFSLISSSVYEEAVWWDIQTPLTKNLTTVYKNLSNDSLGINKNQSIWCWLNVTSVNSTFPRTFTIDVKNNE